MDKNEDKKYVRVSYTEKTWISREGDGKPYSDSGDSETDFQVIGVSCQNESDSPYYNLVEVQEDFADGDVAYVVVVRYDTGDTFGRSNNCGVVVDVCSTTKKANAVGDSCENGKHEGSYRWTGYFDNFRSVEIVKCVVGEVSEYTNRRFYSA